MDVTIDIKTLFIILVLIALIVLIVYGVFVLKRLLVTGRVLMQLLRTHRMLLSILKIQHSMLSATSTDGMVAVGVPVVQLLLVLSVMK